MEDKNVINLRPDTTVELLEQLLAMAKEGQIKNMIFCGQTEDNEVVSGSSKTTPYDEQTLISYLQLNTFKKFLECEKNVIYEK